MAGKTGLAIGLRHDRFIHVPVEMPAKQEKRADPDGSIWHAVLATTGRPARFEQGRIRLMSGNGRLPCSKECLRVAQSCFELTNEREIIPCLPRRQRLLPRPFGGLRRFPASG
jgi:hypothetical protein